MSVPQQRETSETVQCGEYEVPEEFHEIAGWEIEPHDYVMENVSTLWGRNSETVHAIVPWRAERFGRPIESVALVLVERLTRDEPEWQIHREITLATQSRRVKEHPNVGKFFSTPDFEWGLEIAKEWLEANPARTASSMFVPPNPDTNSITERFPYFVSETRECEWGVVSDDEYCAVVPNKNVGFPQNESFNDFVEPDTVEVTERFINTTVDTKSISFARSKFRVYKPLINVDLSTDESIPIGERLRVSPESGNAILSCPNMDGFYLVAPLNDVVN